MTSGAFSWPKINICSDYGLLPTQFTDKYVLPGLNVSNYIGPATSTGLCDGDLIKLLELFLLRYFIVFRLISVKRIFVV